MESKVFKTHSYFSHISRKNWSARNVPFLGIPASTGHNSGIILLFICFCFSAVFISQLIYYAVSVKGRSGKKLPEILSDLWIFLTKGIGICAYYKFYFLMSAWFHTHVFIFTIRWMTILNRNIILGWKGQLGGMVLPLQHFSQGLIMTTAAHGKICIDLLNLGSDSNYACVNLELHHWS